MSRTSGQPGSGAFVTQAPAASGDTTGVTDSNAINALLAAGGTVQLKPASTYIVEGSAGALTLSTARTTLLIPAGTTVRLAAASATGTAIYLTGDDCGVIGSPGAVVDANNVGTSTQAAVLATGVRQTVSGLRLINLPGLGIRTQSDQAKVTNNTVVNAGGSGISVEPVNSTTNATSPLVEGNVVTSLGNFVGINVTFVSTGQVIGARVANNYVTLPATNTSGIAIQVNDCPKAVVSGNVISGGNMGISIPLSDGTTVVGNTITAPYQNGIEVPTVKHASVVGNTIDGNAVTNSGIIADGNSPYTQHLTISGNTITNCTSEGVGAQNGDHLTVIGNGISACPFGLGVSNVASTVIEGNTIQGGTDAMDLTQPNGLVVVNNVFDGQSRQGILLYSATAFTVHAAVIGPNVYLNATPGEPAVLQAGVTYGTDCLVTHATQATTTVTPAAGGAGALPATPLGYVTVNIAGTDRKIAYY